MPEMARLDGAEAAQGTEREERRRNGARRTAAFDVTIASSEGATAPTTVRDISSHGCSIVAEADWLRMGAFVHLHPGGGEPVAGIVRWVRAGAAGIEFLRPLDPGPGLGSLIEDD